MAGVSSEDLAGEMSTSKLTHRTWLLEAFSFLQVGLRASVSC